MQQLTHPGASGYHWTGLPALPTKLIARVLANKYVDFTELPPAKGNGRPTPQSLEGQVQAAELLQARKIIQLLYLDTVLH